MNMNLKVLTAGVLFFTGQALVAQEAKKDSASKEKEIDRVVLFGVVKKKTSEVVGNSVQLSSNDLNTPAAISVDQAIQGKAPGVMVSTSSGSPGAQQSIIIRGIGSISSSNDPLYVIDGVPVVNGDVGMSSSSSTLSTLANINSEDIESYSVLKDAAATALYGARGSNGVIVITTKSGKRGKTRFNLSTAYGFQNEARVNRTPLTGQQRYELLKEAVANRWYSSLPKDQALAQAEARMLANNYGGVARWNGVSTDWTKVLRNKNASLYSIDLSASGGDEKGTFYASLGYNRTEPTMITRNPFERITGLLKVTRKLTDRLNFEGSANGSWITQNPITEQGAYFTNPNLGRTMLSPWANPYNADGSYNIQTFRNYTGLYNIPYLVENDLTKSTSIRALVNAKVDYKIIKNLVFSTKVNLDFLSVGYKNYANRKHGEAANKNGQARQSINNIYNWVVQNSLNYKFSFDAHNFNVLAMYEYQRNQSYLLDGSGQNFPSDNLMNLASVSQKKDTDSKFNDWNNISYLGMLTYNYANRFIIDGSIRREGSSKFARGHRFGTFWSVGGAYNIHKDFLSSVFNELKLRASYGLTGNSGISLNQYQQLLGFDADYDNTGAVYPKTLGNPKLTWEKNRTFDVGLNFALFNRRLSGSFAFYNKYTYDLLLNVPVSRTTGFNSQAFNAGAMVNRGIEAMLSYDVIKNDNFTWNLSANIATVNNYVDKLALDAEGNPILPLSNSYKTTQLGRPFGIWYMPTWAGVNTQTGAPEWYVNGVDGERTSDYTKAKNVEQGSSLPKYTGGVSTQFKYKNVFLNASFYFAGGHKVYEQYAQFYMRTNDFTLATYNGDEELMNAWRKPGDVTNVPKLRYGVNDNFHNTSSRHLYDGTFVRLKDITFGYSIPSDQLKNIGLTGVTFTLRGTNLFTWVKDKGLKLDPETSNATASGMGYTTLTTPPVKSIIFGVNLKF